MSDATLSRTFPAARRTRRCDSCERPILRGKRYHRWTGTSSDVRPGILTFCECASCFNRYGRATYLDGKNRKLADEWMASLGYPPGDGSDTTTEATA